ncbi:MULTISPECIES: TetR/AcrR family transcriptional regulator [Streptomyces]|uniref:TetR family transcriptional regulator n=1 Tax=Streptomyces albus (strain ATCC 21838 / DSM 41398 / FERM P-419 / JCM 4703 / NBRC 107858) TaxID=1081613 RepID=A0A0B5ESX6_STRA4|nr:TetR/AcrR family transcriptional regulator [Streptomyces sp. SCSIO ZS0520]AJE82345.1 TetR family transcriptional regulator [Streptomyces albus]AOU76661.1 TetR family transcriptional regulator [Streptomyces albus]
MDATETSAVRRPMRADARRNYTRLLDAARAAFAEHGTEASLEDIARRAGLGIGTLYRHFPTRNDLLEAVFHESVVGLQEQARALLDSPAPGEALMDWLRATAQHATTYQGLAGSLMTTMLDDAASSPSDCHTRMLSAGEALLVRAQESKAVRPDVEIGELLSLVNGLAWAARRSPAGQDRTHRMLELALWGLVPREV